MRGAHTIFFGVICLLFSCQKKQTFTKPERLIEKQVMINVLYDLSVLQATSNHNLSETISKNIPKFIKQKYDIDSLQFVESNKFYASQIDEYQQMYNEVYARIKDDLTKTEALVK